MKKSKLRIFFSLIRILFKIISNINKFFTFIKECNTRCISSVNYSVIETTYYTTNTTPLISESAAISSNGACVKSILNINTATKHSNDATNVST